MWSSAPTSQIYKQLDKSKFKVFCSLPKGADPKTCSASSKIEDLRKKNAIVCGKNSKKPTKIACN
jgi:hypothetical protein